MSLFIAPVPSLISLCFLQVFFLAILMLAIIGQNFQRSIVPPVSLMWLVSQVFVYVVGIIQLAKSI